MCVTSLARLSNGPQPERLSIDSAHMCGAVDRRQAWRRAREDRIDLETVEAVAREWVAGVVEAGTKETVARAALGRVLGAVKGKAPVDRSSAAWFRCRCGT